MGVDPVGSPVSGPAGVGDAAPAGWQSAVQRRREITDLSRALLDGEGAAIQDGQSGGVVAPVLEALEALQKNRGGRAGTQVADDAAHGTLLLVRALRHHAAGGTAPPALLPPRLRVERTAGPPGSAGDVVPRRGDDAPTVARPRRPDDDRSRAGCLGPVHGLYLVHSV